MLSGGCADCAFAAELQGANIWCEGFSPEIKQKTTGGLEKLAVAPHGYTLRGSIGEGGQKPVTVLAFGL
jgi:hypothetical protein